MSYTVWMHNGRLPREQVGGKGGGRPDMAQAGGTDASKLPAALASGSRWVGERLQAAKE